MSFPFSAASQAIGYIYQVRYALLLLLSEREEAEMTIEGIDDISLEREGDPYQILQLKHHTTPSVITDRSLEFWKTIHNWIYQIRNGNIRLPDTKFIFVTTAIAKDDSVATLLRPDKGRNANLATQKMYIEATSAKNDALKTTDEGKPKTSKLIEYFDSFIAMNSSERERFVENIQVLDSSLNILDIPEKIKKSYLTAVQRDSRNPLYERLEGWWFDKAVSHLSSQASNSTIPRYEVEDKIADLASQFVEGALPIDFFDKEPSIPNDIENRIFVLQLKELGITTTRIEKAISDYYKAFEQRSRWAREDLLWGDELERYEKRLVDEWERFSAAFIEEVSDIEDQEELKKCGRKILNHMEFETSHLRIREKVTEEYVRRGSYHMLADNQNGIAPRVWWHPMFLERIQSLMGISGV